MEESIFSFTSFTETILIGASIVFGFPIPVTAGQILWINLIEDGLPNAALAFEPKEKDIMKKVNDQIPESHRKHTPGFDYLKMDDYRWQLGQEILKLVKHSIN